MLVQVILVSFTLVFIGMFPTDPEKLLTEGDCAGVKITCSDELVANTAKFKDYGVF